MPAIMRILGWKSYGLRCPDHEINCADSNGNPYPITLIQMPNGTGKTTTLTLLRAALSGVASEKMWDLSTIENFRSRSSDQSEGIFEVRLRLNNRQATIVMVFDFENGRVSYMTTYGPGQREGFHPPPDFRRFMNENFVNFYIFDGELAQHLLDRDYTDAQIVVKNLFQINAFDKMSVKVGEFWEEKSQSLSATEGRGLSRRRNRLNNLRKRVKKLSTTQTELQKQRALLHSKLHQKRKNYDQAIKREDARFQDLKAAEAKVEDLKAKVREEALDILERMRDPHALSSSFGIGMLALKDGLDKVKLPESAAREFFEDLASEDECVCGRPIDPAISDMIRARAIHYLGSEDVSLLNSMKTSIKDAVGDTPALGEEGLNQRITMLSSIMDDTREARNDFDALTLEAEQSDPTIKQAREDIEQLQREIEEVDDNFEKFESKDSSQGDDRTFGIEILKKRIKGAEDKLAEITNTLKEKAKRDILTQIIDNARRKAHHGITTELREQVNARIAKLMPNNGIWIDRIEQNLILKEQEGGSAGETLSIAYAFLATLFHRSDHQLPFVVDSPAGPIDLAVRPKIAELIPNLSGQFIAFTISSERAKFIEPLKRASNTNVQFITLFRKGPKELERAAHKIGTVIETDDGLHVEGEDFFNQFQLEEEELT